MSVPRTNRGTRAPVRDDDLYEADEDGTLHAVLPSRCVYATGEQTCAIFVDHYRKRKTGPCSPVAVVGCRVHGEAALHAVSKPGTYPYGRVAVVGVRHRRRTVVGSLRWPGSVGQ